MKLLVWWRGELDQYTCVGGELETKFDIRATVGNWREPGELYGRIGGGHRIYSSDLLAYHIHQSPVGTDVTGPLTRLLVRIVAARRGHQ